MLQRNYFNLFLIGLVYLLMLAADGVFHIHTFSSGFLLCLVFFLSFDQVFLLILALGFFHDVRFFLPFGMTTILLVPFLFGYQYVIKIVRSRMLFLFVYVCAVSSLFSLIEIGTEIRPETILADWISGFLFVLIVYLFAIRRFQDFSLSTKKKSLRF